MAMDGTDIASLLAICKDAVYDCKRVKRVESIPDTFNLTNDEATRVAFYAGYVEGQRKITEELATALRQSCIPGWKRASATVSCELDRISANTAAY